MPSMKWIASAAFGLEGMTGRDLKRLGAENVRVMDVGGAMFEGGFETAFQANLWLRTAGRACRRPPTRSPAKALPGLDAMRLFRGHGL